MSLTEVNYTRLEELLAAKDWFQADLETNQQMLVIADRFKWGGWLRLQDLENLSCSDLQKIDRLWLQYSEANWGFSRQEQIYREVDRDYYKLADLLGWRKDETWVTNNHLILSENVTLPKFPFSFRGLSSRIGEVSLASSSWIEAFFSRLNYCNNNSNY